MTVARDIMETHVVTVAPDTPLTSVYRLFGSEDISGAPVVEQTGEVVGVLSWRDLLRAANEDERSAVDSSRYYRGAGSEDEREWLADLEPVVDRLGDQTVADVMTREVITVSVDAPVKEMAERMVDNRIHRVLVVDDGSPAQLMGIVSVFDLVGLLR